MQRDVKNCTGERQWQTKIEKKIHHQCRMIPLILPFFPFFRHPQTYHGPVFRQAHIAMVILVKRLTFGPCWWLLGDTPIAMVMATGRTLTLPWWWWQEPGMPTNEMMDWCHAGGEGKTWLECPLVMSTVKETFHKSYLHTRLPTETYLCFHGG